jgi:gentisate 1,2-dioxygenase
MAAPEADSGGAVRRLREHEHGGRLAPEIPGAVAEPRRNFLPHVWRYAEVKPILDRAGRLVDTAQAERRNLTMFSPVEGNVYSTVRARSWRLTR